MCNIYNIWLSYDFRSPVSSPDENRKYSGRLFARNHWVSVNWRKNIFKNTDYWKVSTSYKEFLLENEILKNLLSLMAIYETLWERDESTDNSRKNLDI